MFEALAAMLPWNASIENPRWSLNDPASYEEILGGGSRSESGVCVTPQSALGIAAFWQGCSIISGDVAMATLNVHRSGDDRAVDDKHASQFLVSSEPNPETSAFEFWRRLVLHALLWGNGYAYVERVGRTGSPRAIYNLLPDRTSQARLDDGQLVYVTVVDGKQEVLYAEEVFHLKGLSLENGIGYDLMKAARESFGLVISAQSFASEFFSNGSQLGGILEIPATWTEPAKKNLEEGWSKRQTGKGNRFRIAILREGAKFVPTTIDPQKGQMTEFSERQVREVARFLNLLPFKLGLSDSVSYNSQEQGQIQHVTGCLSHWFAAIDGECELKLLSQQERRSRSHYFEHNYSKLIEADSQTMATVLVQLRSAEIVNANEARKKLNLPKRTDPGGEEYTNPNTKSAGATAQSAPVATKPESQSAASNQLPRSARAVCEDAIGRMARAICSQVRSVAKDRSALCRMMDTRCGEHHGRFMEVSRPSAMLLGELTATDGNAISHAWCGQFFAEIVEQVSAVLEPPYLSKDVTENVNTRCRDFEGGIAAKLLDSYFEKECDETAAA